MSTAKALETIGEDDFEILANSILRNIDSDCEKLISIGVNPDGRSVSSLSDGFTPLTNKKSRYLLVEHTTTQTKYLRQKWIGDLKKAINQKDKIKRKYPNSTFKVILTTNRSLYSVNQKINEEKGRNQIPLNIELNELAKSNDIELETVEQSKFVHYLDLDKNGQYIRQIYLKIPAELLSTNLLLDMSKLSLDEFKKNLLLPDPRLVIAKNTDPLHSFQDNYDKSGFLITGPSGSGKSVFLYNSMLELNLKRIPTFWIHQDLVRTSNSPNTLLNKVLLELNPKIIIQDLSRVLSEVSIVFLIIDDITKLEDSHLQLRKIIGWFTSESISYVDSFNSKSTENITNIYTSNTTNLVNEKGRIKLAVNVGLARLPSDLPLGLRIIDIKFFTRKDSWDVFNKMIELFNLDNSNIEINNFIRILNGDPYLFGLLIQKLKAGSTNISSNTKIEFIEVEQLVEIYVKEMIYHLLEDPLDTEEEFMQVLHDIAYDAFENNWVDIPINLFKGKFVKNEKKEKILKRFVSDSKLCKVYNEKFSFHHDRLLEYFQMGSISPMIRFKDADLSKIEKTLSNPYNSKLAAKILYSRGIVDKFFRRIIQNSPSILVEMIIRFDLCTTSFQNKLISLFINQCAEFAKKHCQANLIGDILYEVWHCNNPSILPGLSHFDNIKNSDIYITNNFAKMRQGDIYAALYIISKFYNPYPISFSNAMAYTTLDFLVKHKSKEIKESLLELDFKSLSGNQQIAWQILSCHFQIKMSSRQIYDNWNFARDKLGMTASTLWHLSIIDDQNHQQYSFDILRHIDKLFIPLSDDDKDKEEGTNEENNVTDNQSEINSSLRSSFTTSMRFLLGTINQDNLVQTLIISLTKFSNIKSSIIWILCSSDHPDALETLLRYHADENMIASTIVSEKRLYENDRYLSDISKNRLEAIWRNAEEDEDLRNRCFYIWDYSSNQEDLISIQEIDLSFEPSKTMKNNIISFRAKKGDTSINNLMLSLAKIEDWHLTPLIGIWGPQVSITLSEWIQKDNWLKLEIPVKENHHENERLYQLIHLLSQLPITDANNFLVKNWNILKDQQLIISFSIMFARGELRSLLFKEMEDKRRIGEKYTWMTLKRYLINTNKYIAETTLENSKPYLDLFDDIYYNQLNDLQDEFKLNIIDSNSLMNNYENKELQNKEFPSQETLIDKLTKIIKLRREQNKDQWIAIHPREIYEFFPRDNKLQPKQYWDIITEWIKRQTNTLENFKILCYSAQYTLDIDHVNTIRTEYMSVSMNDYEERNCISKDTEYFIKSRILIS